MAHVRSQIRDAFATSLAGLTVAVKKSRAFPVNQGTDVVFVYATSDRVDQKTSTHLHRTLSVSVEAMAFGKADTIDDTLDGYAVTIETALAGSTLSGLAKDVVLTDTEIAFNGEGETPVGFMRMSYDVRYATTEADPETAT